MFKSLNCYNILLSPAGIPRISFESDSYTVDESDDYVEVCFFTNTGHTEAIDVEIAPVMKGVDAPAASNYYSLANIVLIVETLSHHRS